MRICILCEKDKHSQISEKYKGKDILKIKLSENGQLPLTHYFCSIPVLNQDEANKQLQKQEHSIIEISEIKEFLEKWNLKIIY